MAAMCFEKAGDASDENWARAAGLVESAERNTLTNPVKAKTALQKAADIYETIQMYDKAATCYRKLENYEKAGRIFLERCVPPKFEDAGDCFATIGRWSEAADAYFQAKCSSKCAFACSKGDLLDTGFHYFEKWKLEEEQMLKFRSLRSIRDDYIKNCANLVDQYGDVRSTMQFLKTLNSMEKIRVFLMSKMDIRVLLSGMLQAEGLLEEFFEELLRDAAGIVDVIGDVLSWLGKNKPRVGFYDQLFEDARNALNTIACRGGEKHSDPTLEDLGSLWQDGQAKRKLIMYAHSKPMGSKVASEGEPIDPVVASLQDLCMDSMECVLSYTSEQGTDGKSYDGLLSAVLCMHDESKSSSFDDHLVEEMKQIYNSFSDLARGDAPTLEDLYSKWPHGEIKLKLILGTVITAHKTIPHSCRALGSRPATSIMVEETAVARTSEGSCSTPKKNASKGNKKSKKGGKKKGG